MCLSWVKILLFFKLRDLKVRGPEAKGGVWGGAGEGTSYWEEVNLRKKVGHQVQSISKGLTTRFYGHWGSWDQMLNFKFYFSMLWNPCAIFKSSYRQPHTYCLCQRFLTLGLSTKVRCHQSDVNRSLPSGVWKETLYSDEQLAIWGNTASGGNWGKKGKATFYKESSYPSPFLCKWRAHICSLIGPNKDIAAQFRLGGAGLSSLVKEDSNSFIRVGSEGRSTMQ